MSQAMASPPPTMSAANGSAIQARCPCCDFDSTER